MILKHGARHGFAGFFAVLLAIKLLVKKGLFLLDDLIGHQLLHAPFELILVEVPFSVFGFLGRAITTVTAVDLPPEALGLTVGYPLFVAGVVALIEGPDWRHVGAYWLGSQIITAFAVATSLGLAPDVAGAGTGIMYMLEHHPVAVFIRTAVLALGEFLSAGLEAALGAPVDATLGLLLAVTVAAVLYGIVWERYVGH